METEFGRNFHKTNTIKYITREVLLVNILLKMKKLKIGDKFYELKEVGGAEVPTEDEVVEGEDTESPVDTEESVDAKIDEATEKIVAKLGLDKIHKKLDELATAQKESNLPEKKISALMDLEALMNKDVSKMTTKEKIVGFFQAMVQNNTPVLKALAEGTAADGGYLFPDEFRSEIIRDIADSSYRMRNEVTVIPMRRDIMNIPTLASRPTVTWTDENAVKSTNKLCLQPLNKVVENSVNCWDTQQGIKSPYWTISNQALV